MPKFIFKMMKHLFNSEIISLDVLKIYLKRKNKRHNNYN